MRLIDADATIKYLREFRCKDCDKRKGMKNGKIRFCYEIGDAPCRACDIGDTIDYFLDEDISPTVNAVPIEEQEAVEPLPQNSNGWVRTIKLWYCGACHSKISRRTSKYCPNCGKPILWEGR